MSSTSNCTTPRYTPGATTLKASSVGAGTVYGSVPAARALFWGSSACFVLNIPLAASGVIGRSTLHRHHRMKGNSISEEITAEMAAKTDLVEAMVTTLATALALAFRLQA